MKKKIYFLEKDYKCPASDESIENGIDNFLNYGFDSFFKDEDIEILYQFQLLEKDQLLNILFNPKHILVTYSMYTQGSDFLLIDFLKKAGNNEIKNVTYVDTSGLLLNYLNRKFINIEKFQYSIICAIESNIILTLSNDGLSFSRIRFKASTKYEDCFFLESYEINEYNIS